MQQNQAVRLLVGFVSVVIVLQAAAFQALALAPRDQSSVAVLGQRLALPVPATTAEKEALLLTNPGLRRFLSEVGRGWAVEYDRRSGLPMLLQGPGIAWLPSTASEVDLHARDQSPERRVARLATLAEGAARELLRQHPFLLGINETNLVADPAWTGALDRTNQRFVLTFRVRSGGAMHRQARISFLGAEGKLVAIQSEAFVSNDIGKVARVTDDEAVGRLRAHLGTKTAVLGSSRLVVASLAAPDEPPGEYSGRIGNGYQHVLAYEVRFRVPDEMASYIALVDAETGELVTLHDDNRYAEVTGGTWPRGPWPRTQPVGGPAEEFAPFEHAVIANGVTKITDRGGYYPYGGGSAYTSLLGAFASMVDTCGAVRADHSTPLGDIELGISADTNCSFASSSNTTRAARNTFFFVSRARDLGDEWLGGINAAADQWFDVALGSYVNVVDVCNAYWDPALGTVNFFRSGGGCRNSGEFPDIVMHEWGHGLDQKSKTSAVGDWAKGEALADAVALAATHSQCMAYGFTVAPTGETSYCPTAVRDLALPVTRANIAAYCPRSTTCPGALGYECHCESHILSGALFDLANLLVGRYGQREGWRVFERLLLWAIPSTTAYLPNTAGNAYDNILLADDDDGNVVGGTPNADLIFTAFQGRGISGTQRPVTVGACAQRPAAPQTQATTSGGVVSLSWGAIPSATSYTVMRRGLSGYNPITWNFTSLARGLTATAYVDSEVANGFRYEYIVSANAGACSSAYASAVQAYVCTPCPNLGSYVRPNCFVAVAPSGTTAFVQGRKMYYTYLGSCPLAGSQYDGVGCYMGSAPARTSAFVSSNSLYYTPVCYPPGR